MYGLLVPGSAALVLGWAYLMAGVFADALAPQPGLEPDALERFLGRVRPGLKQVRRLPGRMITHHGRKLYHVWLRWQGYVPIRLSTRVVWQPTHTILTPHSQF